MSGAYDQIRKKDLISASETVNADWVSPSVSLDDRVGAFSISVDYANGSSANMKVFVQLSNDNTNFGEITESETAILDDSGTILFDLEGSGAAFARIKIEVTAGSVDITKIHYNATQFH